MWIWVWVNEWLGEYFVGKDNRRYIYILTNGDKKKDRKIDWKRMIKPYQSKCQSSLLYHERLEEVATSHIKHDSFENELYKFTKFWLLS